MNKHHEQAIDGLDAAIFSGDLLHSHESRDALREALVRWMKAVHEEDVSDRKERQERVLRLQELHNNVGDAIGCHVGDDISKAALNVRQGRDRAMTHLRRNDKRLDATARQFLKDEQA